MLSDQDFLKKLDSVMVRREKFGSAREGDPGWDALLQADRELAEMETRLYECPRCGRIMWDKERTRHFRIYRPEP